MRSLRRSSFGFRSRARHGTPVARKQRYWIQVNDSVVESAGQPTQLTLLNWANIPGIGTMAALSKGVKMLRALVDLRSTTLTTVETRFFGVNLDDASDQGALGWDPGSTTAATQRIPGRVFRWGTLAVPTTAGSLAGVYSPMVFTNRDNVRDIKLGSFLKPDERLFFSVSPAAAAGNQVTFSTMARVLVEIG